MSTLPNAIVLFALFLPTLACSAAVETPPHLPGAGAANYETLRAVDATTDGVTLNPYHAVVRSKVIGAFRGLTAHDAGPALALMGEDVHYTFEGDHALGGTRVTRAGVATWFGRLFRLLPGPFVLRHVAVSGFPWSTRVVTTFAHRVDPPGEPTYWGEGVQIVDLSWGSVHRIHTFLDTARLVRTLDGMAAEGLAEAHAPPILE